MSRLPAALLLVLVAAAGCEWRTLPVPGPAPVYLGPGEALALPQPADSVGTLEGYFSYRERGAVIVPRRRGVIYFGGDVRTVSTLDRALADLRRERPGSFVSDGSVAVRTRTGVSGLQLLIMALFRGESHAEPGLTETFLFQGTVREAPEGGAPDPEAPEGEAPDPEVPDRETPDREARHDP